MIFIKICCSRKTKLISYTVKVLLGLQRTQKIQGSFKVQRKCFFIAEFERAAKMRKIAINHLLISLPVPEL